MPLQRLKPEEEFVLDTAMGRVETAKRAVEQARRELGAAMRSIGLSASARHLNRSRQWALQVAKESEEPRNPSEEGASQGDDLSDSIRRLGIIEPIEAEMIDDGFLRVLDGHRRLRAAREAGISSLPVMLNLAVGERHDEVRVPAEQAARDHRRVVFRYARPDGVEAERTVDVWGVVHRADRSYLIGFDQAREAPRTFRLSRIIGGITFVGEGVAPPEDFSAEASVWGPLDPESLEALEESFRRVLKAERSSDEDDPTSKPAVSSGTRLPSQETSDIWRYMREFDSKLSAELAEILTAVGSSSVDLEAPEIMDAESLHSLQRIQSRLEELKVVEQGLSDTMVEGERWRSHLGTTREQLLVVQGQLRDELAAHWRALDSAIE